MFSVPGRCCTGDDFDFSWFQNESNEVGSPKSQLHAFTATQQERGDQIEEGWTY
jgi:hypothetical protein